MAYLVGALGVAGGAIVALIYALLYRGAKNKLNLLQKDHTSLLASSTELAEKTREEIEKLQDEVDRMTAEKVALDEAIRELRIKCSDPVELNARLNELFPLMPSSGGG